MRMLSGTELLNVWERARPFPPEARAVALLAAVLPDAPPETIADLPLGRRDALLLTLRARLLGERMEAVAACPACGERAEFSFSTADVRVPTPAPPPARPTVRAEGYEVAFRLPASADLAALRHAPDVASARRLLLARCVLDARRGADEAGPDEAGPDELPEPVVAAVAAEMSRLDPQADVRLATACPACAHTWEARFDVAAFLWTEIDAWARRTLREVHLLATAYGWSERDILSLTPWRRQVYLNMTGR
ncbi:T4 family baseplate hub assembly chaperone [Rhodocaloribacter sp.]